MQQKLPMNPIVRERLQARMTRRDFAIALGISYTVLANHEEGLAGALSPKMYRGLRAFGLDADRIADEYDEWRAQVSEAIRAQAAR